ncbi:MAG: chemotaxis protein CheD [Magnetococcus sp. YQC-5]
MQTVRLDPGELFISTQPTEVQTVLGSCVSVSLYHPRLKQGSICHGRKPSRGCVHTACGLKICRELGDYVACSLEFMLAYFDMKGVQRQELEVKLFGGAMMFTNQPVSADHSLWNMGKRNIDTAMDFIRNKRLHLMASDIGGPWARQLVFNTETGEVRLKRVRYTAQELDDLQRI